MRIISNPVCFLYKACVRRWMILFISSNNSLKSSSGLVKSLVPLIPLVSERILSAMRSNSSAEKSANKLTSYCIFIMEYYILFLYKLQYFSVLWMAYFNFPIPGYPITILHRRTFRCISKCCKLYFCLTACVESIFFVIF